MVLERLFCEERQKRLGFPCLERRLRGAMTKVYKVIAAVIKLTVDLSERSIHCKRWGSAMTLVGDWFKPEKKKKKLELAAAERCGGQTPSACSKGSRQIHRSPEMVTKTTTQVCTTGILNAAATDDWGVREEDCRKWAG